MIKKASQLKFYEHLKSHHKKPETLFVNRVLNLVGAARRSLRSIDAKLQQPERIYNETQNL